MLEPLQHATRLIPRAEALFMNNVTRMFSERLSGEEVCIVSRTTNKGWFSELMNRLEGRQSLTVKKPHVTKYLPRNWNDLLEPPKQCQTSMKIWNSKRIDSLQAMFRKWNWISAVTNPRNKSRAAYTPCTGDRQDYVTIILRSTKSDRSKLDIQ
jgi:hypothetical protein